MSIPSTPQRRRWNCCEASTRKPEMPRLADPDVSRVVLIGVGSYADTQEWPTLPAVHANLADLRTAFTDPALWGLPATNCTELINPTDPGAVLEAIWQAAEQAADTIVVYYAGHGSA